MLTYGFNVWIEAVVIPFLGVMAFFLFFRYATNVEINRRFRLLALSTFLAALLEVSSTLLIDGWGHRHIMNLAIRTVYYAAVNLNAYHLMRYVEAYVKIDNPKFDMFNRVLLWSSFIVLALNLLPGFGGFFFVIVNDGGLFRGAYNTLWRSVYVLYFIAMSAYLQITHKEFYPAKSQYIVMNILVGLLVMSFLVQYLVVRSVLITYAVAAVVLYITFFYYEAPTYRQMSTAEEELEKSRAMVEHSTKITNIANRAKSDFLANTSHEIRTPMNAILGMNEMILKECDDPEIRHAALDIRRAGNHLLSIINNILDISKIESDKMELYKTDYHLWHLLKDMEEGNFNVIHDKGLEFILKADKSLPEHLYGDEDKIRRILSNLIENAVKYTSKGKITLTISGSKSPDSRHVNLIMSVNDTGIGIKNEDLSRLFKSFERVNLHETKNIQGAGLGLTLVRYLLELMGGSVKAESEYGKGSTFTVELTQQLAQEGFQGTLSEFEEMLKLYHREDNIIDERPFTCPDAKILIVDDTPVNLVVAKGMLKDFGARIDTAESGLECLELLKDNHYDIVFIDHKMPELDGIETLNLARETDGPSRLAIYIALTANSGTGLREEYISLGFNDYLPKPIKSDALRKILARYIPENLKLR